MLGNGISTRVTADRSGIQSASQDHKIEAAKATRRLVEVQETERRALASQLHDLVGQNLAGLSINATYAIARGGEEVGGG